MKRAPTMETPTVRTGPPGPRLARALLPLAWLVLVLAAVPQHPAGATEPAPVPEPSLEGLWQGEILYAPAEIELELWLELGRDAEGTLVGSVDIPSQDMKFYPLTQVQVDGRKVLFDFHKDGHVKKNVRFVFEGEVSADGDRIDGIFVGWKDDEGRGRVPFELERVEDAFAQRPEPRLSPLTTFSDAGSRLRDAFNDDADRVRLVVLLSPT